MCTREAFPQEWDVVQQALVIAYQQRQQILSRTIGELREQTIQTQTQINILTDQLSQLKEGGIHLPQIHQILRDNIPYFDQKIKNHGYKLANFLKKVIEGTDICLSSDNNKLILRETLTLGSNGSSNTTLNGGAPYLRTRVLTTNSVTQF